MRIVTRSFFFSFLSSLGLAQEPLTNLVAAYPYGEHRCMTVTPDGTRAFVARGAAISVLDVATLLGNTQLQAIQEVEVPDVGPQALAYFRHPTPDSTGVRRRWLFLAGGTLGLARLTLCEGLFQTPPVTCGDTSFQRTRIDRPGSDTTWTWKRCVDVAVVEGNATAGQPLLFALYAANSDAAKSTVGPTELRCYRLQPDGSTPLYATIPLPADGPSGEDAVGTALAADPQDPQHVYVALGTAWLWKVTIGAGTLTADRVSTPSSIEGCSLSPCPAGEAMTDIDLVRVPAVGPVVYAALEYGRVLEYRLGPPLVVKQSTVRCVAPAPQGTQPSYLERISAAARSDGTVLVAVSAQDHPARYVQTTAPFMADGLWSDICISTGTGNANSAPERSTTCRQIHLFSAQPATTLAPLLLREVQPYDRLWGSLVLRHQTGSEFRLYSCSQRSGTSIFRVSAPPADSSSRFVLLATWRGPVFAPADGAMSIVNPGLTFHGQDGFGPYEGVGELEILPTGGGALDFAAVPSVLSACPGTVAPANQNCSTYDAGGRNPFAGSAPGSATWRDPQDANFEWFMPGGRNALPVMNCSIVDLCGVQNPCDTSNPVRWRPLGLFSNGTDVGWDLVRLRPNPQQGPPSTGINLELKWWQVRSPQQAAETRTETVPYVFSASDPRLVDPSPSPNDFPIPVLVHLLRGGSKYGYKLMAPAELMSRALSRCSPSRRGRGENLAPLEVDQPAFAEAITHVEFEAPGPNDDACQIIVPCAGSAAASSIRNLHNNKAHVFPVVRPDGTEAWIAAVAAGFVASAPTAPGSVQQTVSCQWEEDYGRALTTFYDLSDVQLQPGGGTHPPRLIRVALGSPGTQGHAFAVCTRSVGSGPSTRTYAYVADLTGRLLTYDVSWDRLFLPTPPAQGEPYRPIGAPRHPILEPIATIAFPTSAYDGLRPNCVDVEIDGADVYCALERAGIGVVDVSQPAQPVLYTILDTPGAAQGIVFRPFGPSSDVQMVVGDSRAGMRLYGRP